MPDFFQTKLISLSIISRLPPLSLSPLQNLSNPPQNQPLSLKYFKIQPQILHLRMISSPGTFGFAWKRCIFGWNSRIRVGVSSPTYWKLNHWGRGQISTLSSCILLICCICCWVAHKFLAKLVYHNGYGF